jgi:2-oxoglutarate dehydrogenase E2 component (dihydrolipoamide succinyltransferase)
MPVDVVIPELGESITEAVLTAWLVNEGEHVAIDQPIAELETDKATVELPSPIAGVLSHSVTAGSTVAVGDTIATLEPGAAPAVKATPAAVTPLETARPDPVSAAAPPQAAAPTVSTDDARSDSDEILLSPAAKRLVEEHALDAVAIDASGKGGRITKGDVLAHLDQSAAGHQAEPAQDSPTNEPAPERPRIVPSQAAAPSDTARAALSPGLALIRSAKKDDGARAVAAAPVQVSNQPDEERVAMTPMRRTIASRLLSAQQTAAILTTFNEIDMSAVMELRARYKKEFAETHGVNLGFMSFFARACALALADVPAVNARIEDDEIVYNRRVHLGIAASTPKGLVVPVVRNADSMSLADLEREISRLAGVARDGKLSMADMSGGTFTISNGGVFGSLMSTPILNPPQSGILGMHKIEKRAVVIDDEIVIRPMMYVALSYDHRLVDGREAVAYLVGIKERIEDPERMLLGV